MEEYVIKDGKKLRLGYTTGSCAAAAAKAAAWMLLTGHEKRTIDLLTPKGVSLTLDVLEIMRTPDAVSCAIRKDSGDDPDVDAEAKARGVTRAIVSMERAAQLPKPCIFAIGNAPTALVSLEALMEADKLHPALIIGVPVGFVNVIESKELVIANCRAPYIVARGRKGGSNVAAAICNAMLYQIRR